MRAAEPSSSREQLLFPPPTGSRVQQLRQPPHLAALWPTTPNARQRPDTDQVAARRIHHHLCRTGLRASMPRMAFRSSSARAVTSGEDDPGAGRASGEQFRESSEGTASGEPDSSQTSGLPWRPQRVRRRSGCPGTGQTSS